jgi:hypothetical protein
VIERNGIAIANISSTSGGALVEKTKYELARL